MTGADLRTIAELLGHRTLEVVMRYSHLAPGHQRSVVGELVRRKNRRTLGPDRGLGPCWLPQ